MNRATRSASTPSPAIQVAAPDIELDAGVPWRRVLLRMFVVIPPAQVLGIVVGVQLLVATGLLQREHWLSAGISVISGTLSGLAVGFLLTPKARQRRTFLILAACFALATSIVLAVLAEARLNGWGTEPYWYRYALGAAIVVGAQTVIAWRLWVGRTAR